MYSGFIKEIAMVILPCLFSLYNLEFFLRTWNLVLLLMLWFLFGKSRFFPYSKIIDILGKSLLRVQIHHTVETPILKTVVILFIEVDNFWQQTYDLQFSDNTEKFNSYKCTVFQKEIHSSFGSLSHARNIIWI